MEAAIYDRNGNQTFVSDVSSVFDNSGSLLTRVASVLGLIGIGNRITGAIRRITLPSRPPVYTLPKPMPKPPVRRHSIERQIAPSLRMQRAPAPHPYQKPDSRKLHHQPIPRHHSQEAKPPEPQKARQPEKVYQY